ncbi:MAG: SGNH/GDSL hydrolase family protein [Taibaiella sp.]|nr:SGNH/GDSL hydrolase family protein [Taibaiella sp.]
MIWSVRFLLTVGCYLLCLQPCAGTPVKIGARSAAIEYEGRVNFTGSAAQFTWPGTSATIRFKGTELKAWLSDEKGENYYYVIIDGKPIQKIHPVTALQLYTLATHLKNEKHVAQLFKLTESKWGKTWFYGFELPAKTPVIMGTPGNPHQHRIEFYGNSITAGYSVDDSAGDSGAAEFENNYYSYAAIIARHYYNARYTCVAKSGIGLMLSWFPLIMPDMYDRAEETDSVNKWNFEEHKPGIVVIDLMQNDSWLVNKKDHAQFKARFGSTPPEGEFIINAYKNFIANIRKKYPAASIICTLGSMDATKDTTWQSYILKAVQQCNDRNMYTHFLKYKNTPGHPKRKEQQDMANSLIEFIDNHIDW